MSGQCEYFAPVRILACEGVEHAEALCACRTEQIQAQLTPSENMCVARGRGYLLLDFGKELHGGVRFVTFLAKGRVRVRFGESASEACSQLGERGSCNDHALRDFCIELVSFSDAQWGATGYRFVRLDFDDACDISFTGIYGSLVTSAPAPRGFFECDDDTVNTIYETAARTLTLNMQNGLLWDGIKRDRLVWVGDMYPEMLALCDLFGRDTSVTASLELVRAHAGTGWMNGIPAYSAWWCLNVCEYALRSGDDSYFKAHLQDITAVLEQFCACVREGSLAFGADEMAYYFDWPTHGTRDAREGVRCLILLAAQRAQAAFARVKEVCPAAHKLEELMRRAPAPSSFKQVTAMQYLAGCAPIDAGERLARGGARGMSSFQGYFILKATAETVGTQTAYDMMKEFYGGMLSMGATTFWEDFDVDWLQGSVCPVDRLPTLGERDIHGDFGKFCYTGFRHSLCHGWSSGVIGFLTEYLAGVVRGRGGIALHPNLCGLNYLHVRVPLAEGALEFACENGRTKILHCPDNLIVKE